MAFSATNGAINTNFAPSVANGDVRAVEQGPTANTVFLGGSFQGVNGVTRKVVLLNLTTGQLVPGFTAPSMNGAVNDLQLIENRLYVGGLFTSVGNQPHGGLVALNATTGARESFLSVNLTENQNYTGQPGQAQAGVGAKKIAVTPQGDQMAVIGNFRKADGLERRQMVLIDLTGGTAQVRADWKTDRFAPACFSNAFDTYVRDVATSPDGNYFLVGSTGGPTPGSLCDTVSRWNVANTGQSVQPEWIDDTGGDTILSVASSGSAVYAGGHQRWMNNAGGRDNPAPGAVPRPGLGAVDVQSGVPIAWNPGRSPRGAGAESFLVSDTGLWVGSDTEQIGHYTYKRPRIAYFPLTGGVQLGAGNTGDLPSNVYKIAAPPVAGAGAPLYRVNAGGPTLQSGDSGPAWTGDDGGTSPYRNSGSNSAGYATGSLTVDATVPTTTPLELFNTERWDPNDANEMAWSFPVVSGKEVVVRLYLANRCDCTSLAGQRAFDVRLEGQTVLDNYDIAGDVGNQVGTMRSFTVTSDGTINLEWLHAVENPLVNGIEILESVPSTGPEAQITGLSRVWFTGSPVVEPVAAAPAGDIDWASVRGAVVIDGQLFYGTADRQLLKRTFNGETYGPASAIDPYNDPYWSEVATGSGQTYRGTRPSFYNDIATVSGMAYESGRLYYTRSGSNRLFSRAFSPDSGVLSQAVREAPVFSSGALAGVFFDETAENLYFVTASNGSLSRVAWDGAATVGSPVVVSGPAIDGVDWRGRALFLGAGPEPVANVAPEAVINVDCDRLDCSFNGSGSSDPDGTVTSYAWNFGDGSEAVSGANVSHTFEEGTYDVTLTVIDNRGASGSVSSELVVVENMAPVALIADPVCDRLECVFDGSGSADPDDAIESYSWDFGDGSAPVSGATASHTFAEGSYTVTLTVTDEFGTTGSTSVDVEILANQAPVAVIEAPVCELLVCSFDGSGSSDPDGGDSVVSYSWDFGDGSGAVTGVAPSHTYAGAGSYTVTLTVTDESGLTGSVTHVVEVGDGSGPVEAAAELVGTSAVWSLASPAVDVPDEVQAGDLLLMFVSANQAGSVPAPAGWVLEEQTVSGPLAVSLFTRVADGSEAGSQVAVAVPSGVRSDVTLVAYRGVLDGGIEALESAVSANTATHTSPQVTSAGAERVAVTFWADRSSSTTGWTAPGGVDVVSTQIGTGGGRVTTLVTSQTVGAGPYGGLVATTDAASARGVSMTLLLAPTVGDVAPPANQAPVAVIEAPVCELLVCSFDGSGSSDPDGGDSVVSYSWDFGDGSGAVTGVAPSHTYAGAGSYTVTLTVTDESGLTGSVTHVVEVGDGSGPVEAAAELVGTSAVWSLASPAVDVPDEVQAGDLLLMFVSANQAGSVPAPAGWVLEEQTVSGPLAVSLFTRVADGSEAGSQVAVAVPSGVRSDVTLVAYRGVLDGGIEALESAVSANTATHTSPQVTSAGAERVAVTFWADRSSSTTGWTAPGGVDVVSTQIGTGGGRVTTLVTSQTVGAGPYGGLVATTDAASARGVSMTLLLAPTVVGP
ncbi:MULTISPECIES: PKD domain-containing protein [Bacteria]